MRHIKADQHQIRVADKNMELLRSNPYSGRGIVIGLNEQGLGIQVYWISGRSANSQNRVLTQDGDRVCTEPADPLAVLDPSLIIYNAMREHSALGSKLCAVTNGAQTDSLVSGRDPSLNTFARTLEEWQYEPDAPNFTPRISALSEVGDGHFDSRMSILRKRDRSDSCDHDTWHIFSRLYVGHCLTTYTGNGNPLPSFRGEPYLMPLYGTVNEIAWTYWDILNRDTRVSLVVKGVDLVTMRSEVRIINRFEKVTR